MIIPLQPPVGWVQPIYNTRPDLTANSPLPAHIPVRVPHSQRSSSSVGSASSRSGSIGTLDSQGRVVFHPRRNFGAVPQTTVNNSDTTPTVVAAMRVTETDPSGNLVLKYAPEQDPLSEFRRLRESSTGTGSSSSSSNSNAGIGFPVPNGTGTIPHYDVPPIQGPLWRGFFTADVTGNKITGKWSVKNAYLMDLTDMNQGPDVEPGEVIMDIEGNLHERVPPPDVTPVITQAASPTSVQEADRCDLCGSAGHITRVCPQACQMCGQDAIHLGQCPHQFEIDEDYAHECALAEEVQSGRCYKCQSYLHRAANCQADVQCTHCLRLGHRYMYCPQRYGGNGGGNNGRFGNNNQV
jgi:hypothetical protein